ncbi:ATP-dependent DNA helicase [Citricoccus muralis]|uniref:DNA 5'-3' helicase n=1 Tax=Citricoccus muralis TaxID=169134 RepID=A0A3D9L9Q8_9MICC|nr:ATP-dependent DNA helicase [Citricoccus muralis]REE02590.1 ATP-dependent DNA helicase DinG [Citricoccus muralis]
MTETVEEAAPAAVAEPAAEPRTDAEREALRLLDAAVTATGGQRREGQRRMVVEVARSLETGQHLLVQAGTGTGKSLAYLVPALQHALEAENPVVVATATLALQSQIMRRDAPKLLEALREELPRPMNIALVKGRSNYLCKHKLEGGFPEEDGQALFGMADDGEMLSGSDGGPTSPLGREVLRLREWSEETDTGDRDDLDPGVTDRAWRQVSVSAVDCLGAQKCPMAAECFSERARADAGEADVVVTNHAMLAIAAFEGLAVLPEFEAVVVDEAHELQDRVTGAVTGQLSGAIVQAAASSARKHTAIAVEDLVQAGAGLDAAFTATPTGLIPRGPDEVQQNALKAVRDAARQGLSDSKPSGGGADSSADGGRQMARSRMQDVLDVAERMLETTPDTSHPEVLWASRPGHFEPGTGWIPGDESAVPMLYVAPLSVAGKLREGLFGQATTVLTSATLAIGESFNPVAGSLGLMGEGAPAWSGLDVGSPFDYPRQGVLYVARHLPKPGRFAAPETYDELEALLKASGGGALCLFSSKRAAEDAAAEMRTRLGPKPTILCQGDTTLTALVRQFATEEDTCLFGTMSLWQGVDVPGVSCRLVVIDRIPFPRPDDPLSTARSRDISRHGGNGFMAVSASHAAVRLAQGAGRLIRTATDRGVVAVLDSRLATERYGSFLRSTLPDFWPTADPSVVRGVLERLRPAD